MKKFLSILIALVLVMSLGVTALAADYEDGQGAKFTVKYTATNGTAPTEEFSFTAFECKDVTDAADGVTANNAPVPTQIAAFTLESGASKEVEIALPNYESVGIYTYEFNQVVGNTAGVTYYKEDAVQKMNLVVTVINDEDGFLRVAAVHVEAGSTTADKTGEIENTYDSGSLTVSKKVTGNMGDKTKSFTVTVTFTSTDNVKSDITITPAGSATAPQTITFTNGTATAEITLKDGDSVAFANLPADVTYTVTEDDYTDEYDEADYKFSDDNKKIDGGDADTCEITNNKETTPDTGIVLDYLPYVLGMILVLGAAVLMIVRRRRVEE